MMEADSPKMASLVQENFKERIASNEGCGV